MRVVVQKFGGSCVGDPQRIRHVAEVVADTVRAGQPVVVTVSAMGRETDELLELAPRVSSQPEGPELDAVATAGEHKAAGLLALALQDLGIEARSFTGAEAGIVTDERHSEATILEVRPHALVGHLADGCTPVIAGAQGVSRRGRMAFLGRGGTDTTAVALAAALDAEVCEMYTDVAGIFSADPRLVPNPRLLRRISLDQMFEMCRAGCPKPATHAVDYAQTHGVTLHVRSAFETGAGTWIDAIGDPDAKPELPLAIVARTPALPEATASQGDPDAVISLIGGTERSPEIAARMETVLEAHGIRGHDVRAAHGCSSCKVPAAAAQQAVACLHDAFELCGPGRHEESAWPLTPVA